MARLAAPPSEAFRSPRKFPISGSMPSKSATSTSSKPVSKPSMLPRPVLRQAVTSRSKSHVVRKTTGRFFPTSRADYKATNGVSASRIPRPITAARKAVNVHRRPQITKHITTVAACTVTAESPVTLSPSRPLLSKQTHSFYTPTAAPRQSRLPFLVWPLVKKAEKCNAIATSLATLVAKAAPTSGAEPVNTTATFAIKHLDDKTSLASVKIQVIPALGMPFKCALKSAVRQRQGKGSAKSVKFTEGPFSTKLYSTSESVEQISAVSASSDEAAEWEPLFLAACRPYDVTCSGSGPRRMFDIMDKKVTLKRTFVNRYASVRRAEELRRQEAKLVGEYPGLGQLEYGNADYKVAFSITNNVITCGDIGMVLEAKDISCHLPSNVGKMLVFNRFDVDLEDTMVPQKNIVPTKEPLSWPLEIDTWHYKQLFLAVILGTMQAADIEA